MALQRENDSAQLGAFSPTTTPPTTPPTPLPASPSADEYKDDDVGEKVEQRKTNIAKRIASVDEGDDGEEMQEDARWSSPIDE